MYDSVYYHTCTAEPKVQGARAENRSYRIASGRWIMVAERENGNDEAGQKGRSFKLFAQDGAFRVFIRRPATGQANGLGWGLESRRTEEPAGDEAGNAARDLRDGRSEDGGGNGFG